MGKQGFCRPMVAMRIKCSRTARAGIDEAQLPHSYSARAPPRLKIVEGFARLYRLEERRAK
jgi:hypothetical protein